jgi:[protein-PII] uridylyltransferase
MGRILPSLLEIADPGAIREKLDAVRASAKDGLALKRGVVAVLKSALMDGRAKARERLEHGAHPGTRGIGGGGTGHVAG